MNLENLKTETGEFIAHAFPGGYPIFYLAADGEHYCPKCASQEDADPAIIHAEINYEDPELFCDGCSSRIESAYAEDDVAA